MLEIVAPERVASRDASQMGNAGSYICSVIGGQKNVKKTVFARHYKILPKKWAFVRIGQSCVISVRHKGPRHCPFGDWFASV